MKSGKYIQWIDGIPTPVDHEPLTKKAMQAIIPVSVSTPYTPKRDKETGEILESEYEFQHADGSWMAKWEVAQLRRAQKAAEGDLEATKQIEERELGKPKQQVESLTVSITMQDWLTQIAIEEKEEQRTGIAVKHDPIKEVIDISALEPEHEDIDLSWL